MDEQTAKRLFELTDKHSTEIAVLKNRLDTAEKHGAGLTSVPVDLANVLAEVRLNSAKTDALRTEIQQRDSALKSDADQRDKRHESSIKSLQWLIGLIIAGMITVAFRAFTD